MPGRRTISAALSASILPGISKWAGSFGGEWTKPAAVMGRTGQFFVGADASFRSSYSSSPSYSQYLVADGYALLHPRAGVRSPEKWSIPCGRAISPAVTTSS